MTTIASVATAFPPFRYSQEDILHELQTSWAANNGNLATLARMHSRVGVATRNLVLPLDQYKELDTWGKANDCWIREAPVLGEQALRLAFALHLSFGSRLGEISASQIVVGTRSVRCRWLVGADGSHSRIREWSGLAHYRESHVRFGVRRHYRAKPWTDCVEVYWADGHQFYVTPVASDEICVALIGVDSKLRIEAAFEAFPRLRRRLEGVPYASCQRGAVTFSRTLKRVTKSNVALIGDAAGSVDAVTGIGISLALTQASALADALRVEDLSTYERHHRISMRLPIVMSHVLLALSENGVLRRRAIGALSSTSTGFDGLLALHVGYESSVQAWRKAASQLAWHFAFPSPAREA